MSRQKTDIRNAESQSRLLEPVESVICFRVVRFVRVVRVHAAQRQVPGGRFGHAQIRQRLEGANGVSAPCISDFEKNKNKEIKKRSGDLKRFFFGF